MNIQQRIESRLKAELQPSHLEVINESHNHNVPPNSETHFKVVAVSAQFAGKRPVQRHQLVYGILSEELAGPVHALALHTFSPEEWTENTAVTPSPDCMGGKAGESQG